MRDYFSHKFTLACKYNLLHLQRGFLLPGTINALSPRNQSRVWPSCSRCEPPHILSEHKEVLRRLIYIFLIAEQSLKEASAQDPLCTGLSKRAKSRGSASGRRQSPVMICAACSTFRGCRHFLKS